MKIVTAVLILNTILLAVIANKIMVPTSKQLPVPGEVWKTGKYQYLPSDEHYLNTVIECKDGLVVYRNETGISAMQVNEFTSRSTLYRNKATTEMLSRIENLSASVAALRTELAMYNNRPGFMVVTNHSIYGEVLMGE